MGSRLETRFERYGEAMVAALGHADWVAPATWYQQGLILPRGRIDLPAAWTDDPQRCAEAGVSASVCFPSKNRIAAAQIRATGAA